MRKLMLVCAAFSTGVLGWYYHILLLPLALCAMLVVVGSNRWLRLLLVAAGVSTGLLWCALFAHLFYTPMAALSGRTLQLEGTVIDWPTDTQYGNAVTVALSLDDGTRGKVSLYYDYGVDLAPGDHITTVAAFSAMAEGEYSTTIGVFLRATSYGSITVLRPERCPPTLWPLHLTKAIHNSILSAFSSSGAPLALALVVGDKTYLADDFYSALIRTNLIHIVTVSGMHLAFLMALLDRILRPLSRHMRFFFSLPVLFLFMAMVGFGPSVVRSGFMICMLQLAPLFYREDDRPTTLSLILTLLLMQNPYAVRHIGLQLSFAAVAGIYLCADPLYARWTNILDGRNFFFRGLRALLGALAVTLGALTFTIPLIAFHFGRISLVAPLANLAVIGVTAPAFTASFCVAFLGLFSPGLAHGLAQLILPLLRYLEWVVPQLAQLPMASITTSAIYYPLWLLSTYFIFLAWIGFGRRRLLYPTSLCLCTLVLSMLFTNLSFRTDKLSVTALDVGQGQSILLNAQYLALVDCGGNARDNAGDLAADYLSDHGLDHLDFLVLTHYHADHANGVIQLLNRISVAHLMVPDVDEDNPLRQEILSKAKSVGCTIHFITADQTWSLGSGALTLYYPRGDGDDNEEGLIALATTDNFDVLITGDASSTVENTLLSTTKLPDIEVLVAGHHGSKSSTNTALLTETKPEVALISAGYNNHYGHPHQDVLLRLAQADVEIYRTDLMGNITVTANK